MTLTGQVAVLTGAASGIGRACALALARRGCHLALCDIDAAGLAAAATEAQAAGANVGVKVSQHLLDVADRDTVAALPAAVLAAHGRVSLLINNAGVALGGHFDQVTEADFDWLIAINFQGVVRMTRAFLPLLKAQPAARIVNVSSIYGIIAPPGQTAYAAAKFAVRGFSNALRHELTGTSVGVTVVHPGGVATNIANRARVPPGVDPAEAAKRLALANRMLRLSPERAADDILRGIEADAPRVLVGGDAKFIALLERLLPVRYWNLLARLLPPEAGTRTA
jgi:NAD(P)-dependent dehydrogenase (short-subunit alcohol dehydrogenase family)